MFQTPILLLVFNRPDTTAKVFEQIRAIKPRQLFIAADGARKNNVADIEKCAAVRKMVVEGVDWDCEVQTLFREENLGCGVGPAQAITWFFQQVEEGIILEDDCLPSKAFFEYCSVMLNRYRSNKDIFHISGHNPLEAYQSNESFLLSKYSFIWGWATWRHAWEKYDYSLTQWSNKGIKRKIKSLCINSKEWQYWQLAFDKYSKGENRSVWDYQWQFALFVNNGLSIVPAQSLINNIGIGHPDATHTKEGTIVSHTVKTSDFTPHDYTLSNNVNIAFDKAVFNTLFVHWLPKFNLKVFVYERVYKHLPHSIKRLSALLKK